MPPAKPIKKKNQNPKNAPTPVEVPNKLSEVEKKFYELEIADLNKRLANLRSHNEEIEKENEEFQAKFKEKEIDRQDIIAHLDRTLKVRNATIVELESKLAESVKSHKADTKNFEVEIQELKDELDATKKRMTMDIELLEAECHSLKEFRRQRDKLLAKFELQEQNLRDQEERHKKIIYETERKLILDKKSLRETVENKLLELSNEFTKQNETRVAASTQRLVRENISLNLQLDRISKTVDRLQAEHHDMTKRRKEDAMNREIDNDQIKRLIKTGEQQVKIISKMTSEVETLRASRKPHEFVKSSRNTFEELMECKRRLKILERHVNQINFDNGKMKNETEWLTKEYDRMKSILKVVRMTILSAARGEALQDDPEFREHQREHLASELLRLLEDLENQNQQSSLATLTSLSNLYFDTVDEFGWAKTYENVDEIISKLPKVMQDQSLVDTPTISDVTTEDEEEILSNQNVLIDVESGSLRFSTESEGSESIPSDSEMPKFDKEKVLSLSSSESSRQSTSSSHAGNSQKSEEVASPHSSVSSSTKSSVAKEIDDADDD